jgi:hypothetical protein
VDKGCDAAGANTKGIYYIGRVQSAALWANILAPTGLGFTLLAPVCIKCGTQKGASAWASQPEMQYRLETARARDRIIKYGTHFYDPRLESLDSGA